MPRTRDLAVALVAFALSLVVLAGGGGPDARDPDVLGIVLAACASLPLAARGRSSPLALFLATGAAAVAFVGSGYPPGPPVGPTVALFFLAASAVRPRAAVCAAAVGSLYALHVGAIGLAEDRFPTVPILWGALVWGGAWVVGDRVRERRARRVRELRLAAAEERTRIARDLHDSAGHAINVILVQAGAARLRQETDPEGARAAIETIEAVARETIGEIDQLVRALRDDAAGDPGVEAPPGLAALDTLVERRRASGLDAAVSVRGRRAVPASVDRAAFRILQEALTNAARHGLGTARVEVDFGEDALELVVANPVRQNGAGTTGGHGLAGMRERAALLGGALEAGARDGTFRLRARLPYDG